MEHLSLLLTLVAYAICVVAYFTHMSWLIFSATHDDLSRYYVYKIFLGSVILILWPFAILSGFLILFRMLQTLD